MRFRLGLAAATLLLAAQVVHADATSDARKQIQGQYDKMLAALQKKDLDAFGAMCAPNCVFIDKQHPKGIALKEWKALGKQALGFMKTVKPTIQIHSFGLMGSSAVVDSTQTVTMTAVSPKDKSTHTFHSDQKVRDTWVKSGSAWLLKSSNTLSEKDTFDGKPAPGM